MIIIKKIQYQQVSQQYQNCMMSKLNNAKNEWKMTMRIPPIVNNEKAERDML